MAVDVNFDVKRGIDISSWQENVDLQALKSQGHIDFVIIRVGYGVSGTLDPKFKRNAELCQSLHIPMGFYWYSYALNVDEANTEAKHFLAAIAPYAQSPYLQMGCWFDMEDADGFKKTHGMPSHKILKDMCYAFCKKVEDTGYYAGVYASQSWWNNQLAGERLAKFDKWVAQWPTHLGKQKGLSVDPNSNVHNYSLWQFTSKGQFPNIPGTFDVNYAYHDFPNPNKSTDSVSDSVSIPQKYKIGEKVRINGPLYKTANSVAAVGSVENKITNITRYVSGAAHPYNTTGDLGWMNEADIFEYTESVTDSNNSNNKPLITKGSRVRFKGTRSYSGIHLAAWTHNDVFNVIEVSGDRIVIGKGSVVTAAVNIKDCELL